MGRYVFTIKGSLDYNDKYAFATQCSNLPAVLAYIADIYDGAHGAVIHITSKKDDLLQELDRIIKETVEEGCPLCSCLNCKQATIEMLQRFKKAIEEVDDDKIDVWLFSEY